MEDEMLQEKKVTLLNYLLKENHFGPDNFIYTGVSDKVVRDELENKFILIIEQFKTLVCENANREQLLDFLQLSINKFDRNLFDTEDAENIASQFEKIINCISLDSSDGILNDWMYGFDIK